MQRQPGLSLSCVLALIGAVALLGACGGGSGAAGPGAGGGGMPPASVAVMPVVPLTLPAVYEYVGQTTGSRDVEVRARVPGIVLKRHYQEGATVARGQPLFSIDPAQFQAVANRAEADVAAVQARVAQASRAFARVQSLFEARVVTQREFDDAALADQVARADLKGAQARLAEARLNLGYTRVTAPIGGVASRSLVSEGTLVSGPDVLLTTITQNDPMQIRFGMADNDQLRRRDEVAAGRLVLPKGGVFEVEVTLADGQTLQRKGRLLFTDARISTSTGTTEAQAEIANPDGVLKPGQFVRVRLLGASRPNAVQVPSRAVLEGPQGKFVYLNVGNKAQPRPVKVGEQLGDQWLVIDGLKAGDPVIVDGTARIFFPGAPVQLAAASAPAAAPASAPGAPPSSAAAGATTAAPLATPAASAASK